MTMRFIPKTLITLFYFVFSLFYCVLFFNVYYFYILRVLFLHIITVMATKRNTFIDAVDLSETTSLIHLLDTGDVDDDNEALVIKHSAYYGENEFSKLLTNKAG